MSIDMPDYHKAKKISDLVMQKCKKQAEACAMAMYEVKEIPFEEEGFKKLVVYGLTLLAGLHYKGIIRINEEVKNEENTGDSTSNSNSWM